MKIGILTIHSVMNHGAMLQAYATYKIFSKYFDDISIIDYRAYDKQCFYNIKDRLKYELDKGWRYIFNVPRRLYKDRYFLKSNKIISRFINSELTLSQRMYHDDIALKTKEYNAIIVGSDQVWKPANVHNNKEYLLPFFEGRKYSFASSMGINKIDEESAEIYRENLRKFNIVSVRETQGKQILESSVNLSNVSLVLDPTLMLGKDEWLKFSHKSKCKSDKPYIFVYITKPEKEIIEYAEDISRCAKCDVKYIATPGVFGIIKELRGLGARYDITPYDWVYLLNNAEYIITNSFHGIAFSMNLQKKFFIAIKDAESEKSDSRLRNVIERFDLWDRVISDKEDINLSAKIDYDQINNKLETYRRETQDFIEKVIEDIKSSVY